MLVRVTRWSLIIAPVIAGVLVLILGTAGSISTLFGWFLIGIAPIVWMWNWFVRMSFAEEERTAPADHDGGPPEARERSGSEPWGGDDHARTGSSTTRPAAPPHHHPRPRPSRPPRRRS